MPILFIIAPSKYSDRDIILDSIIDMLCDYGDITEIVTNVDKGFNDIVAKLCYDSGMPFHKCELKGGDRPDKEYRQLFSHYKYMKYLLLFREASDKKSKFEMLAEDYEIEVRKIVI